MKISTVVKTVALSALAVTVIGAAGRADADNMQQEAILQQARQATAVPTAAAAEVKPESKGTVYSDDYLKGLQDTVWLYCNNSRMQFPGYTEDVCGNLQDVYSIEFLCNGRGTDANLYCWTEVKE